MSKTIRNIAIGIAAAIAAVFVAKVVTVTNGETRYQRPGPHAGGLAQRWWDFYWTGNADQNRCYFLPAGRIAPEPPVVGPCSSTVPCVPHAPAASGVFDPPHFACPSDPTKECVKTQTGITVAINPGNAGHTVGIGSAHGTAIIGEDGVPYGLVDQCPIQPPTVTPVVQPSKTPTPEPTPPGPTPACVRVTVTPATICVTPTPTQMGLWRMPDIYCGHRPRDTESCASPPSSLKRRRRDEQFG